MSRRLCRSSKVSDVHHDCEADALCGGSSPDLFCAGQPALMVKHVRMFVREEVSLAISVCGPWLMMSCMVARWLLKASLSDSSLQTRWAAPGPMTASPKDAMMAYSRMKICSASVACTASDGASHNEIVIKQTAACATDCAKGAAQEEARA